MTSSLTDWRPPTPEERAALREAECVEAEQERKRLAARSPREVLFDHIMSLQQSICGERCGGCTCSVGGAEEANEMLDAFEAQLRGQ